MKTRHDFQPGDRLIANGRSGTVIERDGNQVTVRWDDGILSKGLHHLLWMCEKLTNDRKAV